MRAKSQTPMAPNAWVRLAQILYTGPSSGANVAKSRSKATQIEVTVGEMATEVMVVIEAFRQIAKIVI